MVGQACNLEKIDGGVHKRRDVTNSKSSGIVCIEWVSYGQTIFLQGRLGCPGVR